MTSGFEFVISMVAPLTEPVLDPSGDLSQQCLGSDEYTKRAQLDFAAHLA